MTNYQNNDDSANAKNHSNFPHDGQFSSFELLWKSAIQELDSWSELADHYDQVLLKAAKRYVERINQSTENMKAVTEQFNRELQEWEGTAREELLMKTTTIKQLFPKKSYHDINLVFDEIHNKLTNMALMPINTLASTNAIRKYIQTTEQMVELRKKGREQYIGKVKQLASIFYGNQKLFFDMLEKQFKTAMFPLQKYMEKSEQFTKI